MPALLRISPCVWLDTQAEEAARFYTAIFPRSRVVRTLRYGEAGRDFHGRAPGSVMTIEVELDGQALTLLNGGPMFKPTEGISLEVVCADQAEVDHYWERLGAGGEHGHCGWLKDRFGVSWQVIPATLRHLPSEVDPVRMDRVMTVLLAMGKLDVAALERAYAGT